MPAGARMFSEHWYRVAGQRVALRAPVRARRQVYRGEVWRVLYDPFTHQFFRLRPAAYAFVARLHPSRTVEEVWRESLEAAPDDTPGQEEVIRLLAQLYHANLLQLDLPPDAEQFFARYRKRKQQEHKAFWLQIMFARFPLLDPDGCLNRLRIYGRIAFSRLGLLVWLAVVGWAVKTAVDHAPRLVQQGQGILAPGNLPLLYLGLVLIKALHEFGHAFACKRFGGEVHTMGIMLMIFTPIPYIDATASWAFRRRRERMLVGAAGMLVELFAAALAVFIWANTAPGLLNALAYNMMFIASVSTILFNGNPLLRYDGYYLLSDLLDIPNLASRSQQQLRYLGERWILGRKQARPPGAPRGEAIWLAVYGVLSGLYRLFVFSAIVLFVSRRFLIAGLVMAAVCVVSWVLVPAGKFIHYLVADPSLDRNRPRAIAATFAVAAAAVAAVGILPLPASFSAPGLVQASEFAEVAPGTAGRLAAIWAESGLRVSPGDPLLLLLDHELPFEAASEQAAREHTLALRQRALGRAAADLAPLEQRLALTDRRLERLHERADRLEVKAPLDGQWVAGPLDDLHGAHLVRGFSVGTVLGDGPMVFRAVVSQQQADRLFGTGLRGARVRLQGAAGEPVEVVRWRIVPADRTDLPSVALGWLGGGEVAVAPEDGEGLRAAESFFEVRAELATTDRLRLAHGRTGRIRFRTDPESAWHQASRAVRQLLQRRDA